jgi:hypothetical protein
LNFEKIYVQLKIRASSIYHNLMLFVSLLM